MDVLYYMLMSYKILEMYCMGYNQVEIASTLVSSPFTVRRVLKELRRSMEYNIKSNKLLED